MVFCRRPLLRRRIGGRLEWEHPVYSWLDIWGQWDTGWYLDIANNWYAAEAHYQNFCNYAFFPFYPTLIKLLGAVIGNHFYAGLIISNASLLGAAILLYKLVELDHDREVALRSVKYLFIWPTSFILSGVLSEALFLMLVIGCFYYARKGAWLKAGITGFFLSLTRVPGVCVGIPLLYDYMKEKNFRLKSIRIDILALALLPLGLLVFCVYNYYLTGDYPGLCPYSADSLGASFRKSFQDLDKWNVRECSKPPHHCSCMVYQFHHGLSCHLLPENTPFLFAILLYISFSTPRKRFGFHATLHGRPVPGFYPVCTAGEGQEGG